MRISGQSRRHAWSRLGLAALLAAPGLAMANADVEKNIANNKNWAMQAGDMFNQRYSTLKQINTGNVGKLVPAWSFSFGGEKQRGQESQPLIHDGVMFVTASYSRIFALDAKTGQKLWKYEHRLPDGIMPCCDVINRDRLPLGRVVDLLDTEPLERGLGGDPEVDDGPDREVDRVVHGSPGAPTSLAIRPDPPARRAGGPIKAPGPPLAHVPRGPILPVGLG